SHGVHDVHALQRTAEVARCLQDLIGAPWIHRDPQHLDALVDQPPGAVVVRRRHQMHQTHLLMTRDRHRVPDHEGATGRGHRGGEPGGDDRDLHERPRPCARSTPRYISSIWSVSCSQVRWGAAARAAAWYRPGRWRIARSASARSRELLPWNTSPTPSSSTTAFISGRSAAAIGRPARIDSNSLLGRAYR